MKKTRESSAYLAPASSSHFLLGHCHSLPAEHSQLQSLREGKFSWISLAFSWCTAAGNLVGHKGCKGEQKQFACDLWAQWEQFGVLLSFFTDHGQWMFLCDYVPGKHPALP